jgi:hypothetical protein
VPSVCLHWGPFLALIHWSAWKVNSPKLGVAISPASALVGSCSASELRTLRLLHLDDQTARLVPYK